MAELRQPPLASVARGSALRTHLLSLALSAIRQGDMAEAERVVNSSVDIDLTLADVFAHYQVELETQNLELRQAQVQTEAALAWSSQLFRSLPVAAVLINHHGVIVDANAQAQADLGLGRGPGTPPWPMRRLMADSETEYRWSTLLTQVSEGRGGQMDDVSIRTARGDTLCIDLRIMQMPPRDGDPLHIQYLCILNDRTQQVEAQRAREAARSAEMQRDLAQAASETKTRLMARVSHEFRTPLNAVIGFSDLLMSGERHLKSPDARRFVQHIHHAGTNLLALVDEVLQINKTMTVRSTAYFTQVDLGEAARAIVEMMAPVAERASVSLEVDVTGGSPPLVLGHDRRVREVVINLVSNAIKYNVPHGWVRVTAGVSPGWAWVCVTDSGVGLDENQRAHLFEPFNRLGAESRDDNGHGLGLVVAKAQLETMGGRLSVKSTPGVGSCFTLEMPVWPHEGSGPVGPDLEPADGAA